MKQPDIFSKQVARRRFLGVGAGVAAAGAVGAVCGTGAGVNTYDEGTRVAARAPAQPVAAAPAAPASSDHSMPPSGVAGRPKASGKLATVYDASLPPLDPSPKKAILAEAKDAVIEVAGGVNFNAWTFDGSVPAKVMHVRQGDSIDLTIKNSTKMGHSIDLHAAQTPWNINYKTILPGAEYSFNWKANYPGVFMYHCGTGPVAQHLLNGMYGAIVIDPEDALPPAREYVLVQSEFYMQQAADGTSWDGDLTRMMAVQPDYVVFNGAANQYQQQPLLASVGERIRLYVVNAGPTLFSAFHAIGTIFDRVYPDGNPENVLRGMSTYTIPPGGGATFELVIPEAGQYPFVTHSFAYTGLGAVGMIQVA